MKVNEFLFETSWEVCNKVGGIHTVLMTKAAIMSQKYGNNYILIGPDLAGNNQNHLEFEEDKDLFKSWKVYAQSLDISIRIGHWKIGTNPIVVLVDFTKYFAKKNEIFTSCWEDFKVDSLTGGWDYVEPFLFGYAAAKVIESYYNYYMSSTDKIVAQFHEWMTGSGVLYLKKHTPQIATAFTTHATVLGRCLAGNNIPLYSQMQTFNGNTIAKDFNVISKYSLEKIASISSDVFTCVSEITNNECKQFFSKSVDIVTPNGFDGEFVPNQENYIKTRTIARGKLLSIINQINGDTQDRFLIINSGRYEFKNKGIDVFIKSMAKLNKAYNLNKKILAVIAVPSAHKGVKISKFATHELENDNDPILNLIKQEGFQNNKEDNVNILFIPSYLDGNDGLINMPYFDFLTAFDLSIFPSYYEPWGYTPMESMAFGIASITTTLTGFGLWVKDNIDNKFNALTIVKRDDNNEQDCINDITDRTTQIINSEEDYKLTLKQQCIKIFQEVQWSKLGKYYLEAYNIALNKASSRLAMYTNKKPLSLNADIKTSWGKEPLWKKFLVKTNLPEKLQPLKEIALNLWWSWNYDAYDLFCSINKEKFLSLGRNPIKLLDSLDSDSCNKLINNKEFISRLTKVKNHFDDYIYSRSKNENDLVAYFSMEFGIHDSLQIFSGGLGMLAGDYLKQASDSNKNIVAIGLLYRQGYFSQHITKEGNQQSTRLIQKFSTLPIQAVRDENGSWLKISLDFPSRKVYAKIWLCKVGVTNLYLLDTDIEDNNEQDRNITAQLYGGDNQMRLQQEILLGIGGIRLLHTLGLKPKIYHLNEGHSAFSSLERMNYLINQQCLQYDVALEIVRSSTLFTTHTPVAAGHDAFEEDLLRAYFSSYASNLNLSWDRFMLLGRKTNEDRKVKFSVSVLAISFANFVNGVSRIHGRVSRQMFQYLYDDYFASEINIGYVTNGVHLDTWVAKPWKELYDKYFDSNYTKDESNPKYWQKIYEVPNEEILLTHKKLKKELIAFVKRRLEKELLSRGESPQLYLKTASILSEDKLTIGFARRFATYKRANLLFTDMKRLEDIVNQGVQFIFAGKAHPADIQGQELIKKIIEVSKMPQFVGKIVFIENYDMYVAKQLIRGVDIWLNTPTRPLEASGTSGEKAVMNGVVNFSVLDGWWAEGYRNDAGWALDEKPTYSNNDLQNILDAEVIYTTLENKIIPLYYDKNDNGWAMQIKNTIAQIAPNYTMKRQMDDYFEKYYNKMFRRTDELSNNNYSLAKEYAEFKELIRKYWDNIELINLQIPSADNEGFALKDIFKAKVTLNTGKINPKNIGIEIIITHKEDNKIQEIDSSAEFTLTNDDPSQAEYSLTMQLNKSGVKDYAFRIFPKHHLMPNKTDINIVKWI